MTDLSDMPDHSKVATENITMTPYDVLDYCKTLLRDRGRLRDQKNNILESSFTQAADLANAIFYHGDTTITELNIMEIMVSLKLARLSAAINNGKNDLDSIQDLICYLAFLFAELKNNYF